MYNKTITYIDVYIYSAVEDTEVPTVTSFLKHKFLHPSNIFYLLKVMSLNST